MTTSSNTSSSSTQPGSLRLQLSATRRPDGADGVWWPWSRDLQTEAADLVDHFPQAAGHINRLLFSRPDWDDSSIDGRGIRKIRAARGPVKVGSFPSDDTHLMVATMASGERLKLTVIPSGTDSGEAARRMRSTPESRTATEGEYDWARFDNESPVMT